MAPIFLKKYFWDIEFKKLDIQKHKVYVLRRILEYGDEKAVEWMQKNFKKSEIKNALCNYRGYSRKSANFWSIILNIPRKEILCLKKRKPCEEEKIWPY